MRDNAHFFHRPGSTAEVLINVKTNKTIPVGNGDVISIGSTRDLEYLQYVPFAFRSRIIDTDPWAEIVWNKSLRVFPNVGTLADGAWYDGMIAPDGNLILCGATGTQIFYQKFNIDTGELTNIINVYEIQGAGQFGGASKVFNNTRIVLHSSDPEVYCMFGTVMGPGANATQYNGYQIASILVKESNSEVLATRYLSYTDFVGDRTVYGQTWLKSVFHLEDYHYLLVGSIQPLQYDNGEKLVNPSIKSMLFEIDMNPTGMTQDYGMDYIGPTITEGTTDEIHDMIQLNDTEFLAIGTTLVTGAGIAQNGQRVCIYGIKRKSDYVYEYPLQNAIFNDVTLTPYAITQNPYSKDVYICCVSNPLQSKSDAYVIVLPNITTIPDLIISAQIFRFGGISAGTIENTYVSPITADKFCLSCSGAFYADARIDSFHIQSNDIMAMKMLSVTELTRVGGVVTPYALDYNINKAYGRHGGSALGLTIPGIQSPNSYTLDVTSIADNGPEQYKYNGK